jgi:hypothetical protein
MSRAILIPADADPEWITLDGADIVSDLRKHLHGWCDFAILARDADRRGIHLAVNERSLLDDTFPHNTLASEIVYGLGGDYHVHGPAILMGLNGPDTVDLTEAQWEFLTGISRRVAAKPEG